MTPKRNRGGLPIIAHIPSLTIFPNLDDGYYHTYDEDDDYYNPGDDTNLL